MATDHYQRGIPPEYRKLKPDGSGITLGDFAEIVTEETLVFLITRMAHEIRDENYRRLIMEEAASVLNMDVEEIRRLLSRIEADIDEDPVDSQGIIFSMNARYAVVMVGSRCAILEEYDDPTFEHSNVRLMRQDDFKKMFANRTILVPHETQSDRMVLRSVAEIWLKSPQRRQYDGIVFMPGRDVPGHYNLWRGLACQPQQGDWCLMRDHIKKIICAGSEDIFRWVLAWMARIVQNPGGERPGTALVLRGAQGTGKSIFVNTYGSLFGLHYVHLTSHRQLTGHFNAHLKHALIVFCDEVVWGGNKEAEGILKGMITEATISLEPKGIDMFTVKNNINVIIASNSEWVVPAGMDERRFCVLAVSPAVMQDKAYFGALVHEIHTGGREAMLYDLLHLDISAIDLRTIPRTEALLDQIVHSMSSMKKFWFDCLRSGTIIEMNEDGWPESIETAKLHEAYVSYARNIGDRYCLSGTQFGKQLHDSCPGIVRQRLSNLGRPYGYRLPSLQECRRQFDAKVGIPVNWEQAENDC